MPTIDQFKGHPVLCLNPSDKFPFSFGLAKAKAILENLEAIRAFVASGGQRVETLHIMEKRA